MFLVCPQGVPSKLLILYLQIGKDLYKTYRLITYRVVHLGWEVNLRNQMSAEIKMPKRSPTMKKLNTYKKYSTLSHQPGTPWGHTRDI